MSHCGGTLESFVPLVTIYDSVLLSILTAILFLALRPKQPHGLPKCYVKECSNTAQIVTPCPKCGNWFCPSHQNQRKARFCAACTPAGIDYFTVQTAKGPR